MSTPVILLTGAGSGIGLCVLNQLLEKQATPRIQILTLCPTPELTALETKYGKTQLNTVYGDACDVPRALSLCQLTVSYTNTPGRRRLWKRQSRRQ